MTFDSSYPEQRYIIPKTTLRRECLLPDDVKGAVLTTVGQRVDSNSIVARGYPPTRHRVLHASEMMRLSHRQNLEDYLLVEVGDVVEEEQALASTRNDPKRGRRVYSPVYGVVAGIDAGRIVIREMTEQLELVAGMAGYVVDVRAGRGVVVETSGAVLQGVWGNNHRSVGNLKMAPEQGMEYIEGGVINLEWRGSIVITRRSLAETGLVIMEEQDIAGVIAPSMDSTLIDVVRQMNRAVLLTEGFGDIPMSRPVYSMLEDITEKFFNVQATVDAVVPNDAVARRPEALSNVPIKQGEEPRMLEPSARFHKNARVRISRAPYGGQTGVIADLPPTPQAIGNGLRVPSAQVELTGGERVMIPLANLELFNV
jgi:hypothetical protein